MKRKWLSLVLCCALLLSCTGVALPAAAAELGDVDGNGEVNHTDARIICDYVLKVQAEPQPELPETADVNGDGEITLTDARLILQNYSEKIPGFSDLTETDGGTLPEDFFSFSRPEFNEGNSTISVTVTFNSSHYLMDGLFYFSFPSDQAKLVLPNPNYQPDPYIQITNLSFPTFNPTWEENVFAVGFCAPDGFDCRSMNAFKLTFRLKDSDVNLFPLSFWADYVMAYDTTNGPYGSIRFTGSRETAATVNVGIPSVSIVPPTQTLYAVGDQLNLDGGCFILDYGDDQAYTLPLTDSVGYISGFDNSTPGIQTLTITCMGVTITHEIEVVEPIFVILIMGDVDLDSEVTSTDARLILQYCAGKIDEQDAAMALADVDLDGEITSTDARLVLQYCAGKPPTFPAE